jgi:hypothetical protein
MYLLENRTDEETRYSDLKTYLEQIYKWFDSVKFDNDIQKTIEHLYRNREVKLSKNESEFEEQTLRHMIKINHLKMLFLCVINLDLRIDYILYPELKDLFQQICNYYENIISMFFNSLYSFTPNPETTVYIVSFCLSLGQVKTLLNDFTQRLTYSDFEKLSQEIHQHFGQYSEEIITFIASNANIYTIESAILSIDEVLKNHLAYPPTINKEDEEKIKQIQFLFKEGKVDKIKLLKFILKLNLSFLSNNKFLEAASCDKTFAKELDMDFIFGREFKKTYNILTPSNYITILDKNPKSLFSSSYDDVLIYVYFTVIFTQYIIRMYFSYLELNNEINSQKLPKDKLLKKQTVKILNNK